MIPFPVNVISGLAVEIGAGVLEVDVVEPPVDDVVGAGVTREEEEEEAEVEDVV